MPLLPFHAPFRHEAGCDEAGRGCLAGPVYAAAVVLPPGFYDALLDDSKKLTAAQRDRLRAVIEREALAWSVAAVDVEEIDALNILRASIRAMHRALATLPVKPEFVLVDGNRFDPYGEVPHLCVVQGDGLYASIAAASILAKTHRDEAMCRLHEAHPHYDWLTTTGYPTLAHREAIRRHGATMHHRRTFQLLPHGEQLEIF
jgi:ribonuclease HII